MSEPHPYDDLRHLWAELPPEEQRLWEAQIKPPRTALEVTSQMCTLARRSVELYSTNNRAVRKWAIGQGCSPDARHPEIWTPQRLDSYVAHLQAQGRRPMTIQGHLVAIERHMTAVAPDVSTRFILDHINALPRGSDPYLKAARMQDMQALWDAGQAHIRFAAEPGQRHNFADVRERTGVNICMLALRPYRLTFFSELELRHEEPPAGYPHPFVLRSFGRLIVGYNGSETTKRRRERKRLPEQLEEPLARYIEGARQRLCARTGYTGCRLWASIKGPLGENGLYKQVVLRTEESFGVAVNPHLFRDCHVTSLARGGSNVTKFAHHALGNSPYVAATVYDHAGTRTADREVAAIMDQLLGE